MSDPLAQVVSLLRPGAPFSKLVEASEPWAVRRTEMGRPFYFAVLEGRCQLRIDGPAGDDTVVLGEGDFLLIPSSRGFTACSLDRAPPGPGDAVTTPVARTARGARVGDPRAPIAVRMLVGNCELDTRHAPVLLALLPQWVHVRGDPRLAALVELVGDEARARRPARDVVTARLLEVLLIEALRAAHQDGSATGLARGLADPQLARALRCMHERPAQPWTMEALAAQAALSRSAFFDRFRRAVGMAPMQYLMGWRMALSEQMLREGALPIAEIAQRVGYSSVSTFGLAFTRHAGTPPGRYARLHRPARAGGASRAGAAAVA
ncbi:MULTISPECIES: AraC family transcriptional regulator [Ramlibacter]|uniref:AraC family transcriptional regulator n=1 Tax=Ramlibacter aquaticus TaxID=2780094 RepID=A0ABR9SFW9_9BURK|nr:MULTISPECIES: AraC family transcriptional regulator [Ramlibacter]MBE7941241.1 AraC family transcriptional regulator [Ramlibacter aquaticus]